MVLTEDQKQYYTRCVADGRADDLVLLTDITDAGVEKVLSKRYEYDEMYTAVGPVLIAVNPYRLIFKGGQALYGEDVARHYYKSNPLEVAPHIFLIASEAYKNMMSYAENHTIIVTGESGAGKTEAAKQLMTFTTFICADEHKSVPTEIERAPARRMSVQRGSSVSMASLSLAERIDAQKKMSPEDKVSRALAELQEKASVNKKLRTRNMKSRQSKNVLAALLPNVAESQVLRTSAENEAELRETFESLSTDDEAGEYVDMSALKQLSQVEELMEMGTIDEDFLRATLRGVSQEPSADPEGIRLGFPQFKQALKVIEVEVQYAEDASRAVRRRQQSVFDYHHAAMDGIYSESDKAADNNDAVNPLQLLTLNDIRSELLESNPVLEAFGNSKTIRNDNSSRFGKYLELQFNDQGGLIGGKVTTYLLEKARLVHQAENERNFHVLHVLIKGATEKEREQYMLEAPQSYNYLRHSDHLDMEEDNDKFTLSTLKDSLKKIGIGESDQHHIFQLLSAILSLGNLTFSDNGEDTAATVTNHEILARCCMLLHVDPGPLEAAIATHKLKQAVPGGGSSDGGGGDTRRRVKTMAIAYHDQTKAAVTRDSLAKELYNRLFLWIVNTINTSIEFRGKHRRTIGILDIYGFEIFQDNHFEQFCINWVNEKLQQFFIDQTLRAEQLEYESENVPWVHIEYFDNKVVVDLIEGKVGVASILDDQLSFKNCGPDTFTASIKSSLGPHTHFVSPDVYARKNQTKNDFRFGIRHYAGEVCYNALSFIDKNTDALYEDLMKVMRHSRSSFIAELFADRRSEEEKSKRPPTIGNQFKKHLTDLVTALKACKPHYVRCIKPNDEKSGEFTNTARLIHQIQYLGIVENVKVRRAGYCHRQVYKDFLFRYRMLSTSTRLSSSGDLKADTLSILAGTSPPSWKHTPSLALPPMVENADYMLGSTKVFIKEPLALFALEASRTIAINALVRNIQSAARRYVALTQFTTIRAGFIKWQAEARRYLAVKWYKATLFRMVRVQALIRKFVERCRFHKLKARCHGVPPFIWARKIQARVKGWLFRREMAATEPEKLAQFQRHMYNITVSIERRFLAKNLLRSCMRVKVRRVIAKRKWDAEYNETLSQLRGEDGLMMIKCRHNGTSAADKTFRLIDRQLIWNTGLFSKMKLGIGLHSTTQVVKGGHTFKTPAGRQSVAFQMKDNPFAKADRESSSERGSQVTMEDLHRRAITIANPPQQEIIVVCHSTNKRDHLVAVLERFCQELDLPTPPPANGDADNGEM